MSGDDMSDGLDPVQAKGDDIVSHSSYRKTLPL